MSELERREKIVAQIQVDEIGIRLLEGDEFMQMISR